MLLVGGSGMQASFKSRRRVEDKEEEMAKILPFLELFCLVLLRPARDLLHTLSHTGSKFGGWLETESVMSSSLPRYVVKPSIYWNEASQHCSASISTIPSSIFPPSKEKGKKKPRMEESRTGEPNPDLDLICSHLIREVNLTRWKYLLWNTAYLMVTQGWQVIISKPTSTARKARCSPSAS